MVSWSWPATSTPIVSAMPIRTTQAGGAHGDGLTYAVRPRSRLHGVEPARQLGHDAAALAIAIGRSALDLGQRTAATRHSPLAGSSTQIFSQGVSVKAGIRG